ncbi:MAG: Hsp70 family protein [Anaerolineaceae bacterium]|nr:Hsp70 family protein [Anaerolineaceae bacterium]
MRLGIDFGTTNSAVAFYDGERLRTVRASVANENPYVLPSLIYIDREQNSTVGIEAAFAYLEHDTGRPVRWRRRVIGSAEIVVAGRDADAISYEQELAALVDVAAHGRLLQSVKTILRNPDYEGTRIFDRFYTVDQLICLLLVALRDCARAHFAAACEDVVIGRPVRFSQDARVDARAEEILYTAALEAGFRDIRFATEPLAVAWLHHVRSEKRETCLVFDFGGGTLDLTVARLGGRQAPEILASRGVLVGGDDLDRAIMRSLTRYFGRGVTDRERRLFPSDWLEMLTSWQTMSDLSRPHNLERIREFQQTSSDPQALKALEALVTRNLGYQLFHEIEGAKRRLSEETETELVFEVGPIRIRERITRERFERMIARELAAVDEGLQQVVTDAGLEAEDVDVVLRTGGSSAVPAFVALLERRFGAQRLTELEPLVSVVGGMAVIAGTQERPLPAGAIRYERPENILLADVATSSDAGHERYAFRPGEAAYLQDSFALDRMPAELSGLPALRLAAIDRDCDDEAYLQLCLTRRARLYVGYDAGAVELPRWLRNWQRERHFLELRDEWRSPRMLHLYSRVYEAGELALGGNRARGHAGETPVNYLVVIKALD